MNFLLFLVRKRSKSVNNGGGTADWRGTGGIKVVGRVGKVYVPKLK